MYAIFYLRPPHGIGVGFEVDDGYRPPAFYAVRQEDARRWPFIRRVYSALALQMFLAAAVAWLLMFVWPVADFFITGSTGGLLIYFVLCSLPLLLLCPLYFNYLHYPFNLFLLGMFSLSLSVAVGVSCAVMKSEILLESLILTGITSAGLVMLFFWTESRNYYFRFVGPFLFAVVMIFLAFAIIQIFFPLGRASLMINSALISLIFCGYVLYDTENVIENYAFYEYVWGAVAIYVDTINVVLSLLVLLQEFVSRWYPCRCLNHCFRFSEITYYGIE